MTACALCRLSKIKDANLQDVLDLSKNSERGGSSTHKQINTPMWKTKSLSISLDFQKTSEHKRLSVPTASKTQTQNTPKELSAGAREGRLNVFQFGQHTRGMKRGYKYWATHLALRHRWGQVVCAPDWQNYTAAFRQSHHPSPQ